MTNFAWKDEYAFGIEIIDSQHKELVQLLDKTYNSFYKFDSQQELARLLNEIKEFALIHFATEEKYFDLFSFEGSQEHKQKHSDLKEKVGSFITRFETEGTKITIELVDFLEDWIVDHMEVMDKKYVKNFKEHGL